MNIFLSISLTYVMDAQKNRHPSVLTYVMDAQKNRLNKTVLLSTHKI